MFLKLFNWLVKRTPYTFAIVSISNIWAVLSATYGAVYIIKRANFETSGTEGIFIFILILTIALAIVYQILQNGFLRFFGIIKLERKESRILNNNILKGKLISDISTKDLLKTYQSVAEAPKKFLLTNIQLTIFVIFSVVTAEMTKGALENAFIILQGGLIALIIFIIGLMFFYETATSSIRKKVKDNLSERNQNFEELAFLSLRSKMWFFIVILFLGLLVTAMIFVNYMDLTIVIFLFFSLIIFYLLSDLFFNAIYGRFREIKDFTKKLETGKRTAFFTGGLDKEIIDLSKSLNNTADKLYKTRREIEESKKILEIKVMAKTRELKELAMQREQIIKGKTEELQKKIKELERFQKLTVGRELEMVKLKKELKDKNKIKNLKRSKKK